MPAEMVSESRAPNLPSPVVRKGSDEFDDLKALPE
jgi:hypothetical protein